MSIKKGLSFRAVAVLTAASFLAVSCGGGAQGGGADPFPGEEASLRGGVIPGDIEADVEALRAQGPIILPSAEHGTIGGGASVDGRGNARYSMPIDVAPGPNGQQPALSIGYSSAASNGKLGLGFSLGGVPTMARCRHSISDDGFVGGIEFEDDDALCFNGQRLTLISGAYGEQGSEYRTVRDPRSKIVLETGTIDVRQSEWVVYEPSGRVLRFGGAARVAVGPDSLTGGFVAPFAWLLESTADRFGNSVLYDWTVTPGFGDGTPDYRLEEIEYGSATVDLIYETRNNDETEGYYAGIPYRRDQRLSEIVVNGLKSTELHTYDLKYDGHPQTDQSILTSVQKCDAAGACLPATTFDWSSVNADLQSSGCDEISEDAYDENGDFQELTEEDLRILAPAHSVVLDTFGDLRQEVLLWDGDVGTPWLWANSVPGVASIEWRQTQTNGLPSLGALPPSGSESDPAIHHPGWRPSATRFTGDDRSDLLVPLNYPEAGTEPVSPSDPAFDYWGVPFATDFSVRSHAISNATENRVDFSATPYDDGEGAAGGKIYAMVPLDHDGDGLSDLWICRGDGFKTGRWVLGLNDGVGTAPFAFDWTQTDIQCSAHDELLVMSLRGDGRTSLLTVPAYSSPLSASSFGGDYDAYLTHPGLQPIPDQERDEYLEVSVDAAGMLSTGLPRGYFQSWHDKNCKNAIADEEFGMPVYSAGIGADRVVDINGDGYSDIIRAELATGDDFGNISEIKHGIDATEFPTEEVEFQPEPLIPGGPLPPVELVEVFDYDAFGCSPTSDQDLVLRAYINTGSSFVRDDDALHSFPGIAHANYWVNWRGAVLFDHNSDGLLDFLLPGLGNASSDGVVMSSQPDGEYVVGGDPSLPGHYPSYNDSTDPDWEALFGTSSRAFATDDGHQIWFVGLGGPTTNGLCPGGSVAQQAAISGAQGRVMLEGVTNGLGARQEFSYRLGPSGEATGPRPAGRMRKQDTIVRELRVQVGPGPDDDAPPMRSTQYSYADPRYDDHGRGLVGYALVRESTYEGTATRYYDLQYNAAIADYPYAGRPQRVETISYNETGGGQLQRVITCEDVDEWHLIRPYQGATWFSYAANVHNYTFTVLDNDQDGEEGCDDGTSYIQEATTETEMNGWGVMTSRRFTTGDDVMSTTVSDWIIDDDEWFVRPRRTQEQSCVAGVCQTRTSWRDYDASKHTLLEVVREPDATDSTYRRASFGYDPTTGNLLSTTVEGFGGADPRTASTEWAAGGVLALSSTNAEGHKSWVVPDSNSGVAFAVVGPNGVTKRMVLDGFYRPRRTNRHSSPLGVNDGLALIVSISPGDPALGAAIEINEQVSGQSTRTQIGPTGNVLQVTYRGVARTEVFPYPEQGPLGGDIYFRNEYDSLGRLARTSHNTFAGNDPDYWTTFEYDQSSRRRRAVVTTAGGAELLETERQWDVTLSAAWNGSLLPQESSYTDEESNTQSKITDRKGRVTVSFDAVGTATCYDYGPFGRLDAVHRNCAVGATGPQPSTTYSYDQIGRLETETDPAFGTRTVSYSAFDQIVATVDAESQVVFSQYDDLGRRVLEVSPEGQSIWTFDTTLLGAPGGSLSPDGIGREYDYDDFGRLSQERTLLPPLGNQTSGDEVSVDYEYQLGDRVSAIEFEKNLGVRFNYDAAGYHRSTHFYSPSASGVVEELVWGWEESDENTSVVGEVFGNAPLPADRTRTYRLYDDATGRLEASSTATGGSNGQAYSFGWTPAGDLDWRLDSHSGQAEEFEHDSLHRLVESEVAGVVRSYAYDALGNFTSKDGVGSYTYDAQGTRLLHTSNATTSTTYSYNDNGSVENFGSADIQWTSFGKVDEIVQGADSRRFSYDADGARVVRRSDGKSTVTAHSLYERRHGKKGELEELRLKVPSATGAVVAEFRYKPAPGLPIPTWKTKAPYFVRAETRYIHDDHLGSAGLTTDETGAEVERIAFDPWGRARDADDWNVYLADDATDELPIGFTGHQAELDGGLINMRGRMYDPRLGRFMSVDPIIENATNVQTWNSYSYVQNRPLSAVDPSGLGANDGGGGGGDGPALGGGGDNVDCGRDESPAAGCQRTITVRVNSVSATGFPGNVGPIGGYWGSGDGSGVGMRGANAVGGEAPLQDLAAANQAKDELAYQDAVRRVVSNRRSKPLPRAGGCADDTCRALQGIASEGGSIKLPPAATAEAYRALEEGRDANKGLPAAEFVALWVVRLMPWGGTAELILGAIEGNGDPEAWMDRGMTPGAGKNNTPRSTVPRGKNGDFLPDPVASGRSHTTVGTREGRRGTYRQGASFDSTGEFKGITDVTTHGRGHPNPHFHPAKGSDSITHGPHPLPSPEGF